MALVDVDDLRDYMSNIVLSDSQYESAELILEGVQGELERYLNRTVTLQEREERLRVDRDGGVTVSNSPIYRILSVVPASDHLSAAPAGEYIEDVVTDITTGLVIDNRVPYDVSGINGGSSSYGASTIFPYAYSINAEYVVRYIGGYNGTNDTSLKLAILRVVSREMGTQHDDTVGILGASVTRQAAPQTVGWTPEELRQWDHLRRRTAV